MEKIERVLVTCEAKKVISELKRLHGDLMFHQSGGCCDGSSPMCFRLGEFRIGQNDIQLGTIEDCPYYISRQQYEYSKHTQTIIDVTEGRGSSFSLEIPLGIRFILRTRAFNQEELRILQLETLSNTNM